MILEIKRTLKIEITKPDEFRQQSYQCEFNLYIYLEATQHGPSSRI